MTAAPRDSAVALAAAREWPASAPGGRVLVVGATPPCDGFRTIRRGIRIARTGRPHVPRGFGAGSEGSHAIRRGRDAGNDGWRASRRGILASHELFFAALSVSCRGVRLPAPIPRRNPRRPSRNPQRLLRNPRRSSRAACLPSRAPPRLQREWRIPHPVTHRLRREARDSSREARHRLRICERSSTATRLPSGTSALHSKRWPQITAHVNAQRERTGQLIAALKTSSRTSKQAAPKKGRSAFRGCGPALANSSGRDRSGMPG